MSNVTSNLVNEWSERSWLWFGDPLYTYHFYGPKAYIDRPPPTVRNSEVNLNYNIGALGVSVVQNSEVVRYSGAVIELSLWEFQSALSVIRYNIIMSAIRSVR